MVFPDHWLNALQHSDILTAAPEARDARTKIYCDYHFAEKVYWLEQVRNHISDPALREDAEQYAEEINLDKFGFKPNDAKGHWSAISGFMRATIELEHPLDISMDSNQKFREAAYASDYHGTSQYVHCSLHSLTNYCPEPSKQFTVKSFPGRDNNLEKLFYIIVLNLYLCSAYALFGLGLDVPDELNQLFSGAVSDLPAIASA